MNVLVLNHAIQNCGVYQYGKRLADILSKSMDIRYIYKEIMTYDEYTTVLSNHPNIYCIIYNYHNYTMPWLNAQTIQHYVKNIGIPHESHCTIFDSLIEINPSDCGNPFSIPRPLFENIDLQLKGYTPSTNTIKEFIEYSEPNIPIIGSFGFGFDSKGFHKIVEKVNLEYNSAIIKLVIPVAHYDPDNKDHTIMNAKNKCIQSNHKSSVKLLITHEFFTNEDLLFFLKSNTINAFMYDKMQGRSISSTIDYALSAQVPLGISDSAMFRHIFSNQINLCTNTIDECIITSKDYCKQFTEKWSHAEMINRFKVILTNL